MIDFIPQLEDRKQYYSFTPYRSTLYGRDSAPYRFLRILDKENGQCFRTSFETKRLVNNVESDIIVENIDIESFIQYCAFGYTPFIECAFSNLKNAIELDKNTISQIMTQSITRNYAARADILMQLAEDKKMSFLTRNMSDPRTSELVDELDGVLSQWEIFLNTGRPAPYNCLKFIPGRKDVMMGIPYKRFWNKYLELRERTADNNCVNLPFKLPQDEILRLSKQFV